MKYGKVLMAMGMALVLSFSCQVQNNCAEARGLFGGVLDSIAGAIGGSEDKALHLDMDGLNHSQTSMLENLGTAEFLFASALADADEGAGMSSEVVGEMRQVAAEIHSDPYNLDLVKQASQVEVSEKELRDRLQATLDSGDQDAIELARERMKSAQLKRIAAGVYCAWAICDGRDILKSTIAGLQGSDEDKLVTIVNFVKTAKNVITLCNAQNKHIKTLNAATKIFEKNQHIEKPSKEEALEATNDLVAN